MRRLVTAKERRDEEVRVISEVLQTHNYYWQDTSEMLEKVAIEIVEALDKREYDQVTLFELLKGKFYPQEWNKIENRLKVGTNTSDYLSFRMQGKKDDGQWDCGVDIMCQEDYWMIRITDGFILHRDTDSGKYSKNDTHLIEERYSDKAPWSVLYVAKEFIKEKLL